MATATVMDMAMASRAQSKRPAAALLMLEKPWRWWLAALALALSASFLAAEAAVNALGQALRFSNPALAYRYIEQDGIASATFADQLLKQGGQKADITAIERISKSSLRKEPINPTAFRLLGLASEAKSQTNAARAWLQLANRASRRDLGTQLWLIENAAKSGDLPGALQHYDIALRTSPQSNAVLFPILTAGIADAEIRTGLIPLIRAEPSWLFEFLNYAAQNTAAQGNLALLIADAGGLPDKPYFDDLGGRLLGALAVSNNPRSARRLFLSLRGASRANLATTGFNSANTEARFNPLTWEAVSTAGLGAVFDGNGKGARVLVGSGERGVVLRRMMYLTPGNYVLTVDQSLIAAAPGTGQDWRMTCAPVGTRTARDMIDDGDVKPATPFTTSVSIPRGCDSQVIELAVVGGTGQTDMEFMVQNISIDPVLAKPPATGANT